MYEVDGFKEHTIFAPKDLSVFSAKKQLPVLVWGNVGWHRRPYLEMGQGTVPRPFIFRYIAVAIHTTTTITPIAANR